MIKAIDEDYFLDLKDDLATLGAFISDNSSLMKTAINNELDINWLINGEIPENIVPFHKNLRQQGFLK